MVRNMTSEQKDSNDDRPELSARDLIRCFGYLGKYKMLVILGIVLCSVCVWAEMELIKQSGKLIDNIDIVGGSVWALTMPFLVYGAISRACGGLQWVMTTYATNRATLSLRRAFFEKLQTLSKSFYDTHKVGWLVTRNSSDLSRIGDFLTYPLMMTAIFVTTFTFAIIQIARINLMMLLPLVIISPIFAFMTSYYRKHMRRANRQASKQNSKIVANITETVRGIRVVHAFSREDENFDKFEELNSENRRLNIRVARLQGLFMPSLDFIGMLNMTLVIGFSFWLIGYSERTGSASIITAGDVTQYVLYMNAVLHPLRLVTEIYGMTFAASAAAERVFEIMDMEPDVKEPADPILLESLRGEIELKNMSFRYTDDQDMILKDINLHIPAKQTVAIVGETGAGKTTIASLMARLYDPVSGSVCIDGYDLRQLSSVALHRKMGFVPQQGYLFTGTVMENLKFASPQLSDSEVIAVAKNLGTHISMAALPEGYSTKVLEGGDGLSLGQRQIIAITRAVLSDPTILIMDEPTSSLDIYHERLIQTALEKICEDRTTIVIAHRLSTVERAEKILVLAGSTIQESGSHDELLALKGKYYKMYQKAAEGYLGKV